MKKNYKKLLRLELLLHNKISLTPKIFHFVSINIDISIFECIIKFPIIL